AFGCRRSSRRAALLVGVIGVVEEGALTRLHVVPGLHLQASSRVALVRLTDEPGAACGIFQIRLPLPHLVHDSVPGTGLKGAQPYNCTIARLGDAVEPILGEEIVLDRGDGVARMGDGVAQCALFSAARQWRVERVAPHRGDTARPRQSIRPYLATHASAVSRSRVMGFAQPVERHDVVLLPKKRALGT